MLLPKRVKYRKMQRGRRKGIAVVGSTVSFGEYGIKAMTHGWIKNTQIEACRLILTRRLRRGGKMWIRIFPDKSVTKQALGSRQGKGKGEIDAWVAVIKRGRMLFEISGVSEEFAREAFRLVAYKLPLKTRFLARRHK